MTHAYDELGNRISTTLPNGRRVDTLRYGSGHWHSTLWQGKAIVDIERDKLHRARKRYLGRGAEAQRMVASREYDPQSRLSTMTLARPSAGPHERALSERHFAYDPVGNLLSITLGPDAHDGAFTYTYDPVGQLLAAIQPGLSETFVFDPAGNLLDTGAAQLNISQAPAAAVSPAAGKLSAITANLLSTLHGHRYQYDAQGNVVTKRLAAGVSGIGSPTSELALEYDADNRLRRSVRTEDLMRHTAEYFYDAFSRRIAKRVVADVWQENQQRGHSATTTIFFVWDGDVLTQEQTCQETVTYLYEPDSFVPTARVASRGVYYASGTNGEDTTKPVEPSHPRIRRHVEQKGSFDGARLEAVARSVHLWHVKQWASPGAAHTETDVCLANVDESSEEEHQSMWLQRQRDANADAPDDRINYFNCDHLGTPRELVDENGRIVWTARSKAWGRTYSNAGNTVGVIASLSAQPLRFQGQYEDAETGLFYNRYRYYDPDDSRYITQDPIGLLGGLNSYTYAPNPVSWYDPTGLKKTCPATPNCDPCVGKNPAAWARQWQGHGAYKGRDNWKNTVLPEGTEIYGGTPGQSGFYFDEATLATYGATKATLWHSLQVLKNPKFGYRRAAQKYRLKKDTCVAISLAEAQVSTTENDFGYGGGIQYFMSDFKRALESVGPRIPLN
jgi:RHS repeat-associated protein